MSEKNPLTSRAAGMKKSSNTIEEIEQHTKRKKIPATEWIYENQKNVPTDFACSGICENDNTSPW